MAVAKQELRHINSLLVQNEIDGFRLFYIAPGTMTLIATKPGDVAYFYDYQIAVRNTGYGSQKVKDLCSALEHTDIRTTTQKRGDFKWGCAFYKRRTEVAFISMDNVKKVAQINGVVVSMRGGMNQWMAQYLDAITALSPKKRQNGRKTYQKPYQGAAFAFDPEDRLTSAPTKAGGTFGASYDGDGLRATKTISGVTTYFLFDGTTPIAEESFNGTAASFTALNGWTVDGWRARKQGSLVYQFVYDPQGSVQQRHTDTGYSSGFAAYDRSTFEG